MNLPRSVRHLRCDNPGPMTLTGTNTYVVTAGPEAYVIDPGPPVENARVHTHVEAVAEAARAGTVTVLLTHHHVDHTGAVAALTGALERSGCAVTVRGGGCGSALEHDERVGPLTALAVPGHTADSVAFLLESGDDAVVFTGDTVLGGSSSFVAHPDGDLTDYLESLDALIDRVDGRRALLAPGHGEVGGDAERELHGYREHRRERLVQVQQVLDDIGPGADADDVIAAVYGDIGPELRPAVEAIVAAQLAHLRR